MLVRPLELDDPAGLDTALTVIGDAFVEPDTPASEPVEVGLTRRLVAGPAFIQALALAATIPKSGAMIGVVLGTRATIGDQPAIGLGPLAVAPAHQSAGVGSALVHAVGAAADTLEFPLAALLGEPKYYSRFGFRAADGLGVIAPDAQWGEYFQARRLSSWTSRVHEEFHYSAPFMEL